MVRESEAEHGTQWKTVNSVAEKIGCSGETLRNSVRQAEREEGRRTGPTSDEKARIRNLEREVRELRQANEILRRASACFARAELDRPLKR
jgi:transposase-like protein